MIVEWTYKVTMKLGFDCAPPEGSENTSWDIADAAVDKINTFLSTEPGGKANERFTSNNSELRVGIEIPVTELSAAGTLFNKLKNALDNFPPLLSGAMPSYFFEAKAHEVQDPE